jgi:putative molybdopterin biosynthesis protein
MAMSSIERHLTFEQIKLLADKRRLSILRHLMAAPASLTQLGQVLGEHPAWVRHHLKLLEQAGLVEIVETRVTAGVVEKFYQARAGGLLLQELILPEDASRPVIVFSGSHDLAIELLARQLTDHLNLLTLSVGSLDGLVTLRQGLCSLSGAHLLDPGGEYNAPFVRHFFPDREARLVTLAHREQGLMLSPGNPKAIRSLADLVRPDVVFVNRQKGSGTRLWLDNELHRLGIPPDSVRGYDREVSLHTECARIVRNGDADAAIGLRAAAHQAGLDFIPLFQERYDLVFPQEQAASLAPLLETIQTRIFRRSVDELSGYDTTHTGEQIPL